MIKNSFYTLTYNSDENRVYFKAAGHWQVDDVPEFENDWNNITGDIKRGFTVLADVIGAGSFSEEVSYILQKVQQMLIIEKGCRKIAQVAAHDEVDRVNQILRDAGTSDFLRAFADFSDAEQWLDMQE